MDRIFLAVVISGLLLLAGAASLLALSKENAIDPIREAPPLLRVPERTIGINAGWQPRCALP